MKLQMASSNKKVDVKESNSKEKDKIEESKENDNVIKEEETIEETTEEQVTLEEIKSKLKSKMSSEQRKSLIKESVINVGLAFVMCFFLIIVFAGYKNIVSNEMLITDLKVFSIFSVISGIVLLEMSYKKDNLKLVLYGTEVIIFGAIILSLIYVVRLYQNSLFNFIKYAQFGICGYYIIKILVATFKNMKIYKDDNNDIKDIIKK